MGGLGNPGDEYLMGGISANTWSCRHGHHTPRCPAEAGSPMRPDERPQEAPARHPVQSRSDALSRSNQLTVPLAFRSSPFCSKPEKIIELVVVVGQGENRLRRKWGRVNQNSPTRLLIECQPDTWRGWGDFATFCWRKNFCNLNSIWETLIESYRFPILKIDCSILPNFWCYFYLGEDLLSTFSKSESGQSASFWLGFSMRKQNRVWVLTFLLLFGSKWVAIFTRISFRKNTTWRSQIGLNKFIILKTTNNQHKL